MLRRDFLAGLRRLPVLAVPAVLTAADAPASVQLMLQESPVAGFQYHDGEAAWPLLTVGQGLRLRREADRRHDPRAVAVYAGWNLPPIRDGGYGSRSHCWPNRAGTNPHDFYVGDGESGVSALEVMDSPLSPRAR